MSSLPPDDDFLNHKISDILKQLNSGEEAATLYAAQHGADSEAGIPPSVFVLVGVGDTAGVLYEVFREIGIRYGLELREEF